MYRPCFKHKIQNYKYVKLPFTSQEEVQTVMTQWMVQDYTSKIKYKKIRREIKKEVFHQVYTPIYASFIKDYMVSFYLRQRWQDKRLAYNCSSSRYDTIKLGHGTWNKIWLPDTFFRNEKKANFHEVTVDNRMLRLNCNGTVWYVTK